MYFNNQDADLEEVTDYASYFTTRGGRLYQRSTNSSPYPLPVDTPENKRHQFQHRALAQVTGAHYTGPVPEVLAPQEGTRKAVVDFGCGTGEWVQDMANEFPHVSFYGLEIVPIVPNENLPENVQFEIHDIGEQTRLGDASVDMVHARSVFMAVRNYRFIIQEAARILKPGGLFLSGEWQFTPAFHPDAPGAENPSEAVPGLERFYQLLRNALAAREIDSSVTSKLKQGLIESGAFTDIQGGAAHIPIGNKLDDDFFHEMALENRDHLMKFIETVRPLLIASGGVDSREMNEVQGQCLSELGGIGGLISVYLLAYGRKI